MFYKPFLPFWFYRERKIAAAVHCEQVEQSGGLLKQKSAQRLKVGECKFLFSIITCESAVRLLSPKAAITSQLSVAFSYAKKRVPMYAKLQGVPASILTTLRVALSSAILAPVDEFKPLKPTFLWFYVTPLRLRVFGRQIYARPNDEPTAERVITVALLWKLDLKVNRYTIMLSSASREEEHETNT